MSIASRIQFFASLAGQQQQQQQPLPAVATPAPTFWGHHHHQQDQQQQPLPAVLTPAPTFWGHHQQDQQQQLPHPSPAISDPQLSIPASANITNADDDSSKPTPFLSIRERIARLNPQHNPAPASHIRRRHNNSNNNAGGGGGGGGAAESSWTKKYPRPAPYSLNRSTHNHNHGAQNKPLVTPVQRTPAVSQQAAAEHHHHHEADDERVDVKSRSFADLFAAFGGGPVNNGRPRPSPLPPVAVVAPPAEEQQSDAMDVDEDGHGTGLVGATAAGGARSPFPRFAFSHPSQLRRGNGQQ